MLIEENKKELILRDVKCFNLALTVDCGEAFRWARDEDGFWSGVAFGKYIKIRQNCDGSLEFINTNMGDFNNIWYDYFDLGRDYEAICRQISEDSVIKDAVSEYYGIRILKQEPWEALTSFIISQQNNIPRIKRIIEKICSKWGDEIDEGIYSFPSAEKMAALSEDDFKEVGAGYRASYLSAFSKGVAEGNIDLEKIGRMNLEDAKKELLKIKGVGIKVANCALLFGFNFLECFPIDVWIERAMKYYPDGLPECFKPYEGIAQQYLYHWIRNKEQ